MVSPLMDQPELDEHELREGIKNMQALIRIEINTTLFGGLSQLEA